MFSWEMYTKQLSTKGNNVFHCKFMYKHTDFEYLMKKEAKYLILPEYQQTFYFFATKKWYFQQTFFPSI